MKQRQRNKELRLQALSKGQVTYKVPNPCRKGHEGKRYSKTGHCTECQNERTLKYSRKPRSKELAKKARLKREYGLTESQYKKGLRKGCEICGCKFKGTGTDAQAACVDHCHNTGETRGFLCNHCNMALGLFKDDKERLESAITYLSKTIPLEWIEEEPKDE